MLVAHGGVLDAIYRLATRQALDAPRTWKLPNAAINRLLWSPEGGYTLGLWGLVVTGLAATLALWAAQRVARPAD